MIPLKFLQCWNGYDRGQEVPNFPHPGLAEDLVRMGVAVVIEAAPQTNRGTPQAKVATPKTRKG